MNPLRNDNSHLTPTHPHSSRMPPIAVKADVPASSGTARQRPFEELIYEQLHRLETMATARPATLPPASPLRLAALGPASRQPAGSRRLLQQYGRWLEPSPSLHELA